MGYGDIYPRTQLGRLIMVIASVVGVVIMSILVVSCTNLLEMDDFEAQAFTTIKKLNLKKEVKNQASSIIGKAFRLYRNLKENEAIRVDNIHHLYSSTIEFKNLIRMYRSENNQISNNDLIREIQGT